MKRLLSIGLILMVMSVAGCGTLVIGSAAAVLGGTGVLYYRGKAEKVYAASLERCYDATLTAAENLGYELEKKALGKSSGKVVVKNAESDNVTVKMTPLAPESTKLTIRVGVFGDQKESQAIIDEIDRALGRL